jgi:hypothetical protein
MKRTRKILFALTALVILACLGVFMWLRSNTLVFEGKMLADCSQLGKTAIAIPIKTTVTKLGRVTCEVDLSWVADNFEAIMRKGLPREGGSGGERYSFSGFRLTTNEAGQAVGFVHVKLMNYGYFNAPDPKWNDPFHMRQVDVWKGTVEDDVFSTIQPKFDSGFPETVTVISIVKTREAGFVRLWNDALPKIWFSLDRKLHTAQNEANANAGNALLVFRKNPKVEMILKDLLARKAVIADSVRFGKSAKGLTLTAEYKLASGFKTYYELLSAYNQFRKLPSSEGHAD